MPGSSAWLTNYRSTFLDKQGTTVTIDIEDRASGNGTAAYTPFKCTGEPITLQTVNNDQDPFAPIVAMKAVIKFVSTALINADTFSSGNDNRFFVEAYTATTILFRGFLLMDDIEEDLQNPAFGNVVTLVATDNIGTLKERELIDPVADAALIDGHYTLLYYLQSALALTGLSLKLNIAFNVFEEDMVTTASPLDQAYLHSLTFEKEISTKEDAYTVLQKILSSLKCRLFQYNGEWWMVRMHEHRREADTLRVITYDTDGSIYNSFTDLSTALTVQGGTSVKWVNADAIKTAQRPHKYDKDEYRLEYPKEVPQNVSFIRGDQSFLLDPYKPLATYGTLSSFPATGVSGKFYQATDTGLYYQWNGDNYVQVMASAFEIDNWTFLRSEVGSYVTPDSTPYIRRTYDLVGTENGREVVIPAKAIPSTLVNQYYLVSEEIPVHYMDRAAVSVDFRLSDDVDGPSGTSYTPVMQIRFTGEDGSKWLWTDGTPAGNNNYETKPRWVNVSTPGTFINVAHFVWAYWDLKQTADQEWQSVNADLGALPMSGSIQIALVHANPFLSYDKIFTNLRFEYIPFIGGSYQKYGSQYNKVTGTDNKANREETLAISDSPKKLFKGALKKYNGTAYVLTELWTDGFVNGYPDPARLGKILVYDTWNQYRKQRVVISGTIKGIGNAHAYGLLFQRFTFADYSTTKRFICLHYDLNVKRNEVRGEWIEVHDTDDTNDYLTPHDFNYVQ